MPMEMPMEMPMAGVMAAGMVGMVEETHVWQYTPNQEPHNPGLLAPKFLQLAQRLPNLLIQQLAALARPHRTQPITQFRRQP